METKNAAAVGTAVIAIILVAAFFVGIQQQQQQQQVQGEASSSSQTQSSSSASSSTTTTSSVSSRSRSSSTSTSGSGGAGPPGGLELQLSVDASSTAGPGSQVTFHIRVSEYNALATANNVTMGTAWPVSGLSLGACGTGTYPFGIGVYRGSYIASNVSAAQPVRIYPIVPCPMLIRFVSGYLFQPDSDLAVVLPGGAGATATPAVANVTAMVEYSGGPASSSSAKPLGPGTYTIVAGDEWGSLLLTHFTIGPGTTSSTTTGNGVAASTGTIMANFTVGPIQPVCRGTSTVGPAPAQYSSIEAVITPQSSGQAAITLPISWLSNGCDALGSLKTTLAPGSYSLSLSNCQFMGCSSSLPKSFAIVAGQSARVSISIDTGIR